MVRISRTCDDSVENLRVFSFQRHTRDHWLKMLKSLVGCAKLKVSVDFSARGHRMIRMRDWGPGTAGGVALTGPQV